jgi:hypothetical protein
MAPFFPSWLGNGTSRRSLPVTLSLGLLEVSYRETAWAVFEEDEEMAAMDRYGTRAADGLAVTTMAVSGGVARAGHRATGAYLGAPWRSLISLMKASLLLPQDMTREVRRGERRGGRYEGGSGGAEGWCEAAFKNR